MTKPLNASDFTLFSVFTGKNALGNPAAVAAVNKLPNYSDHKGFNLPFATTVYIKTIESGAFAIRWFSNKGQIQRCGHGTLAAAAYVDDQVMQETSDEIRFHSDYETITVFRKTDLWCLELSPVALSEIETYNLPFECRRAARTDDEQGYMIVELDAQGIRSFKLTSEVITAMGERALIVSAKGNGTIADIVFRYFAPQYGPDEDSATGSAAAVIWPFWKADFNAKPLVCYQASAAGGLLQLYPHTRGITVSGLVTKK